MREIAEFVAVLSCSLFAGAAIYISLVEHPARMECRVEIAATEFAPSYLRATVMQATLAGVGLLSLPKTSSAYRHPLLEKLIEASFKLRSKGATVFWIANRGVLKRNS